LKIAAGPVWMCLNEIYPPMILPRLLALSLAASALAEAGPILTVRDSQGRALEIELLSSDGENVSFRRTDNKLEFTLPLARFDEASQAAVREKAASLPPVVPKIEPEVVIGKRRQKEGYYMERQTVTCTVKLRNTSKNLPVPELTAKMVFIGQDRRVTTKFSVLARREFKIRIEPGQTFSEELKPFTTRYDSDNKGYGNVGGYQYTGFLLVVTDAEDNLVLEHTTDPTIKKGFARDLNFSRMLVGQRAGTVLDERLQTDTVE
jgi:hypothetical protein